MKIIMIEDFSINNESVDIELHRGQKLNDRIYNRNFLGYLIFEKFAKEVEE